MAEERTAALIDGDDERFEVGPLGRAALWAGLALVAALGALLAARSDTGSQRIVAALNGFPPAAPVASARSAEPRARELARIAAVEAEMRRLAENVRALTADGGRLQTRIEAVERSIEVTAATPASAAQAEQTHAAPSPAATGAAQAAAPALTRTEFGLDLGAAATLQELRDVWNLLRAQHGALLHGLWPVVAVRDHSGGPELRLVAGPLTDAASAARLCAVLGATGRACAPTPFDGQRLALR